MTCLRFLARQEEQQIFKQCFTVIFVAEPVSVTPHSHVLLIILTNHSVHLFQQGLHRWGEKKREKAHVQCSFTGFLISGPHEGTFMLMTGDSTSRHYCNPHLGILSAGSTKAHSSRTTGQTKSTQPCYKSTMVSPITSPHTLIMINMCSDISTSLVLQLQPSVSTQIPHGRSHHVFIPSDLTGTTTKGSQLKSTDSFIMF